MFLLGFETLLLLILLCILLYIYGTWPYSYWKVRGIDGPKPSMFIGNFATTMKLGFHKAMIKYTEEYKHKRVMGNFMGRVPQLYVFDLDILKEILIKDFGNFTDRMRFEQGPPMERNLLVLTGDHWKHVRSRISPIFSTVKLKRMTPIIQKCCKTFVEVMLEKSKDPVVQEKGIDVKDFVSNFTMDITGQTLFGLDVDSTKNPENLFVKNCKATMKATFQSIPFFASLFFPFMIPIMKKFNLLSFFPKDVNLYFTSIINSAFDERKEDSEENQKDFLQHMVNVEVPESTQDKIDSITGFEWSDKGLTRKEILSQAILFILAGFNTTSDTISFVLFNLAAYPEWQEKVYQEIMEKMTTEENEYEDVQNLVYLDMVFNESMRLYPAAPRIDRVCRKPCEINGVHFDEGVIVSVAIFGIHRNNDIWPEADKFKPERFSPENKADIHACAFMPFGAGPRHCVAMRLATLEVKLSLVYILRALKFSKAEDTPNEISFNNMTRPLPFYLKFEPRNIK